MLTILTALFAVPYADAAYSTAVHPAFISDAPVIPSPPTETGRSRRTKGANCLAGEIMIPAPIDDVWTILSDYNRAAEFFPSLVESRVQSTHSGTPGDGTFRGQVRQKGVTNVSLGNLDYSEIVLNVAESFQTNGGRSLNFNLAENLVLSSLTGSWTIFSTSPQETCLRYESQVETKFPVPVQVAIASLKEDTPKNLNAIRSAACELAKARQESDSPENNEVQRRRIGAQPNHNIGGRPQSTGFSSRTISRISREQPARMGRRQEALAMTMAQDILAPPSLWEPSETLAKYL